MTALALAPSPPVKTYGRLDYGTNQALGIAMYRINAVPHVAQQMKRVFPRADQNTPGVIWMRDTPAVARDLEWFMTRWPLEADPAVLAHLADQADKHRRTEEAVLLILEGYRPPNGWRELAVPPRDYQLAADAIHHATGRVLLADDLGLGKAQPLDSPVLTPAGFRPMGDIRPGDLVIAGDGMPTRVIGVFPQGEQDCYRVTFSDGATVECNDEHLWRVTRRRRARSKATGELLPYYWQVKTLRELIDGGLFKWERQAKWHIPMTGAADLDGGGARPLDPYLLGVLLGDGGFTGGSVALTTADAEIVASVETAVPPGVTVKQRAKYGYQLVSTEGPANGLVCACGRDAGARGLCGRCYQAAKASGKPLPDLVGPARHPVIGPLRDLELWGHSNLAKFVPEAYKLSPAECRLAVLQGLMDTHGSAIPLRGGSATAQFSSSSRALAEDVCWLAESLGGTGRLGSRFAADRERYTATVKLPRPLNPFRLSRKARLWGDGHATLAPTRAIVSAELVGRKPMQCIAVEHPSRLYVTDRFAVTHNTCSGLLRFRDPGALPGLVVAPVHLCTQWQRELEKFAPWLNVHVVTKGRPYDPTALRAPRRPGAARKDADPRQPDVWIMSYHKLPGWADHLAGRIRSVIFEEVHELRTGYGTAKWSAAANIAHHADFRMGLSATPIFNYGDEIWNICEVLAPGELGSMDEFVREWCGRRAGMGGHNLVDDPAMLGGYLRETGLMLCRTREELHMELPEPILIEQPVDTDHVTVDDVAAQCAEQARILAGEVDADWTARGQAFREIDWKMRQATGVAKAPYVAEFVKLLLESEERAVVWCWHRDVYDVMLRELAAFRPVLYSGSETPKQKDASRDAFCGGGSRVLLMSLRSGAGLDGLQEWCSAGVFAEMDWSPEQHAQCIGRLNRDGQASTVVAYYMISDAGTDPLMCEVHGLKRQQAVPIRRPDAPVLASLTDPSERARQLAASVLARVSASPKSGAAARTGIRVR